MNMNRLSEQERQAFLSKFSSMSKVDKKNIKEGGGKSLKTGALAFKDLILYKKIKSHEVIAKQMGLKNPFMQTHEQIAKDYTVVDGQKYLNFSTYDYLSLNGNDEVNQAGIEAMRRYGTSSTASRLVAGQRTIHQELESALAEHYGQEDCLCFVSGHATNIAVISTIFDKHDLILYDKLSHNSILLGSKYSGAKCLAYAHNDPQSLLQLLQEHRGRHAKCLIVTEGVFSMDGDIAPLPHLIEIKKKFNAFLMVDEAHALGVIGDRGYGSLEYGHVNPQDVDIVMGTLSKTLCGCGGYIAGCRELIEILKFTAPGFIYSVGLSPVLAAVSLKALQMMHSDQARIDRLKENCAFAYDYAQQLDLKIGSAQGTAILPIIVGSSIRATYLVNLLYENQILALPIIFPAVEEEKARIRLFLSVAHERDQIRYALDRIKEFLPKASEYERQYVNSHN